jgi:glutamine amidotransferase
MRLAIVASAVGNLASVQAAVDRLGAPYDLTADPDVISAASHVIFPGVGAAKAAMADVDAKGLRAVLQGLKQPLLGVCLGMQLLYEGSSEGGGIDCLGLIPSRIERLPDCGLTIPHMGWNQLNLKQVDHPLLRGVKNGDYVYFVHSFYAPIGAETLASADHGVEISAVVQRGNVYGCQFHPERSGPVGARILANFLEL